MILLTHGIPPIDWSWRRDGEIEGMEIPKRTAADEARQ